jgi:hypothetical protein
MKYNADESAYTIAVEPYVSNLACSSDYKRQPACSLICPFSLGHCFDYREINGGSCIAMLGDKCVAIACDLRLGNQALTVNCNFEKVR